MSEPAPEPIPYPWLPRDRVRRWLKALEGVNDYEIDDVRVAAADWVEHQRKDLFVDAEDPEDPPVYTPTPAIVQAGVLAAARLWARKSSPAGLAEFAEFGAAGVLRTDPDVTRLLRTGLRPKVG